MEKVDKRKFWLGTVMALAGVAMLFTALFIPPQGEISGSALGAAGEIFLVAGSLLGLDSYFDFKLKRYLGKNGNEQ